MLSPGVGGISGLIESEIDGVCTIRSDVKVIGSYAFRDHTSIKELILSDEVEKICSFAFENCTNLKRISRSPKSKLNTIEACAFIGCVSLTDFDLTNVSNIAESAFSGCSNFDVSNNKGKKNNIYMPVAGKDVVSSDGRKTTRITVNTSEPSEMVLFKGVPAIINNLKTRGDGDNAEEESELLIYNIQIEPKKIYACNSIAEVTGGEYVGLEYLQQELPGQKVTGDDADLPKPGDVNGDDVVNAVDIVMTIDHINGGFSATFCKSAANLKADDTIDQADVDEMVKLILNQK